VIKDMQVNHQVYDFDGQRDGCRPVIFALLSLYDDRPVLNIEIPDFQPAHFFWPDKAVEIHQVSRQEKSYTHLSRIRPGDIIPTIFTRLKLRRIKYSQSG
jgi:hypothetical protein